MKVIVKTAGWYGGVFYEEGTKEQEMPESVAIQFLSPYGDQLEKKSEPAEKQSENKTPTKVNENKLIGKAG